jgi:glycerophosphoryl diester phosphodiesterase
MNPLLDPDARPVIGHRGASGTAPENTLQSFALAVEQGADAIEFDVRLSSDGVPLVIHDPTLARTCNRREPVAALSAREIQAADAGYHFSTDGGHSWPYRNQEVCVPTVAQVLERFPTLPLLIEVKETRASAPLATLIREHGAMSRVVVASFLERALLAFASAPAIATGASKPGIARLWASAVTHLPAPRPRYAVYAIPDRYRGRIPVATRRFVRIAGRLGCPVHVWTVNDPGRARQLWAMGVNGVITNYPAMMVAERRAGGRV